MTSRTPSWTTADGADRHPDIELLADLAEGLVAPEPASDLHRHLAGCPDCEDTFAALAEVRSLLGAVEAPPLPADVAERIDAALAAEAAHLAAAEPLRAEAQPAGAQPAEPQPTDSDRLSGRAAPTERTVRPAQAVPAPPNRPADRARPGSPATATSGPDRAGGPGRSAPAGRRRRRGRLVLGAAALIAVLGIGGLIVWQNQPEIRRDSTTATAASGPVQTPAGTPGANGTDAQHPAVAPADGTQLFQDDQLTAQIHQLVAAKAAPKAPSPAGAQPEKAETPALGSRLSSGVPGCLVGVTAGITGSPLAVGHGRYDGSEVTALVYPLPDRPDSLDVYLVTPSCPGAAVLLHRVLPAH
ncbi:hypothetical protein [Kitasatospora sp. HPMI-4]|uniref:anti-sigma factor family protein n=1 Tax=Kitasatospora sp. HPMI-4 TaxID=3448443 RepID=UPI003F1D81A4